MLQNTELLQNALDKQTDTEPLRRLGDIYGLAKKVAEHKARKETYEILELDEYKGSELN